MARERKKSFLLYESQRSLVSLLTEPERAALLMAIYDYVATGKCEKLPTVAAEIAFTAIREQLDIDAARYYGVCAASEEKTRKHRKSRKTPKNPLEGDEKERASGIESAQCDEKGGSAAVAYLYDTDTENENEADNDNDTDADAKEAAPSGGERESAQSAFDRFFSLYPRKANRMAAYKVWRRHVKKKGLAERIMAALRMAMAQDFRFIEQGGAYTPFPAAWLENEAPWRVDYRPQIRRVSEARGESLPQGSFNTDDFFAAALRRSYEGGGKRDAEKKA